MPSIVGKRSSELCFGIQIWCCSGVHVSAVLAIAAAHWERKHLAGALEAAANTIITLDSEEYRLIAVEIEQPTRLTLLISEARPVIPHVRGQVGVVGDVVAIPRHRDVLSGLEFQRMIRATATSIPVITDLVKTNKLVLGFRGWACIHRECCSLRSARRATTAIFGQQFQVLAYGKHIRRAENTP